MTPVASLAMYDLPTLRPATDRLWATIRDHMRATGPEPMPEQLDHARPPEQVWLDPGLVLAQTCGLPLVTTLRGKVRLVATPCYDLPGCEGPNYCSFIVVAATSSAESLAELHGRTVAINDRNSQSGANALWQAIPGGQAFFGDIVVTGSHRASLAAIASGTSDVAAIDCVTHGLLGLHAPECLAGTRILGRTRLTPGLPLITARTTPDAVIDRLLGALVAACPVRELHFGGVAVLGLEQYRQARPGGSAPWTPARNLVPGPH